MFDLNSIAEFSRCHCVGICALLVPTNLLLAIATLLATALDRSPRTIYAIVGSGIIPALALFLHVATWWSIGVVMLPTFILPLLATTCLVIYAYALINRQHLRNLLLALYEFTIAKYQQLVTD
jgi:phosphate/sulfate permease